MRVLMKYLYCVIIPLLLQIITVYIIIEMNTGNGSWLGLAAFLFSIPILPATTIYNAVRTKVKTEARILMLFGQNLLIAFIAPIVIVALYAGLIILESLI
jgi:hypothetical protein